MSKKIERVDDDLRRLIDHMIETMHEAPGVGLAGIDPALQGARQAPRVGDPA